MKYAVILLIALVIIHRQGGNEDGINYASGVTALADDSVVLVGTTSGDFAGAGAHMGGFDFAAIKLTAAGVEEWRWQVCERPFSRYYDHQANNRE